MPATSRAFVRHPDADATRRFYTALFGWTVAAAGGHGLVATGADHGIAGGLGGGQATRWATVYARVPDVAQALARAAELGGWREYGPEPPAGHRAAGAFRDPAGNVFGVYHHTAP
jgi:predicted enzyme related to lactoylglutathione lyase